MNRRIGFTTTILLCLLGTAWAQVTTGQLEGHIQNLLRYCIPSMLQRDVMCA